MKNYLVFHGHFYQPPREDPWTGLIPYQESAAPFHDWNQRITKECYAANAASRFLRYDGRIEDIINNYEILSFNFGPTLLRWLKSYAPHIHEAIVEADSRSAKLHNGHGNAIAQSFNHTILPLDTEDDARLQIRWGLEDFVSHFGREAEGMWLPETAVNGGVLDILIEEGLRFVILSPWQAESIKADGSNKAVELEGEPAPYRRPYRIERPGGSITAFFYNHELASGISFEHYLQNADSLYTRLVNYHDNADPSHLIHTATDGEIYGHHEPFGDMCIAALRTHVEREGKFEFTNYAAYLDSHPPEYTATLKPGEGDKGTSWSCFHGVSRWHKDCGCSTGGKPEWDQKWRTPLRKGFISLSEKMRKIYRDRCAALAGEDPEQILDRYIDVLTGAISREEFAQQFLGKMAEDREKREELFTLLEGNVFRMYMFTSCGWFFADISGLEPVQNIHYAHKAIRLYKNYTDEDLYGLLRGFLGDAKSNIPSKGNGADILDKAEERLLDGVEGAIYFFIVLLVSDNTPEETTYGNYSLIRIEKGTWDPKFSEAHIELKDGTREKHYSFTCSIEYTEEGSLNLRIDDRNSSNASYLQDLSKLPKELRNKINNYLVQTTEESLSELASTLFDEVKDAIVRSSELSTSASPTITKTAEISLHSLLFRHLPDGSNPPTEESVEKVEELLDFAAAYHLSLEKEQIRSRMGDYQRSYTEKLEEGICDEECDLFLRLLNALRRGGIEQDFTILQKIVFSHVEKWRELLGLKKTKAKTKTLKKEQRKELLRLIGICNAVGIYVDDLMRRVSERGKP